MPMHSFTLTAARIAKFKGEILKHAVPVEVLNRVGRQIPMPRNQSDTVIFRRWLPYNATSTDQNTQNRFFQDGTGDRTNALVQANQIAEGVTPAPESIVPVDITVVLQQYGCLYGFTDKAYYLYEDDIPKAMTEQVGERVTLINELICWGAWRGGTNVFYGGTGTSIATVNGGITLGFLRKITKNLQANHGKEVHRMLSASRNYDTSAVSSGYCIYGHTDLEPDIRDLPNFTPTEKYASGSPMPYEVGKCERMRFVLSPELVAIQDAGAAVGATGLSSTTGTNIDVYPFLVEAQDACAQVAVRGLQAMAPTFLSPGQKTKSDPLGQRGYIGTQWWKAAFVENNGWQAVCHVGSKDLN